MSHPHIVQADRDAIEDRGLVDNDHTPEMRRAPVAPEAPLLQIPLTGHHNRKEI